MLRIWAKNIGGNGLTYCLDDFDDDRNTLSVGCNVFELKLTIAKTVHTVSSWVEVFFNGKKLEDNSKSLEKCGLIEKKGYLGFSEYTSEVTFKVVKQTKKILQFKKADSKNKS